MIGVKLPRVGNLTRASTAVAVKNFYGAHPVHRGERERVCGAAAAVKGIFRRCPSEKQRSRNGKNWPQLL